MISNFALCVAMENYQTVAWERVRVIFTTTTKNISKSSNSLIKDDNDRDCICDRKGFLAIEPVRITETRTELRCYRCKGLLGWWDEPSKVKKIVPPKRDWTEEELNSLR